MGRHKENAKSFVMSVFTLSNQEVMTVPKPLHERAVRTGAVIETRMVLIPSKDGSVTVQITVE